MCLYMKSNVRSSFVEYRERSNFLAVFQHLVNNNRQVESFAHSKLCANYL